MMVTSPVSGWLSDKYSARELSSIGLLISAAGLMSLMRISQHSSIPGLIGWMMLMGFGSGMFFSGTTPNGYFFAGTVTEKPGANAGFLPAGLRP